MLAFSRASRATGYLESVVRGSTGISLRPVTEDT